MTSDEARSRFQAALDDELSAQEREAFEKALSRDEVLALEYAQLSGVVEETRALSVDVPAVDLLSGIQRELRQRSGGRFYRDRFAEQRGRAFWLLPALLLGTLLLLAAASWLWFVR